MGNPATAQVDRDVVDAAAVEHQIAGDQLARADPPGLLFLGDRVVRQRHARGGPRRLGVAGAVERGRAGGGPDVRRTDLRAGVRDRLAGPATDVRHRTRHRLEYATGYVAGAAVRLLAQLLQVVQLGLEVLLLRGQVGILLLLLADQNVQRHLLLVVLVDLVAGCRDGLLLLAGELVERTHLVEQVLRAAGRQQCGDAGCRPVLVELGRHRADPRHR